MRRTHTHTHVIVHSWAQTDVLKRDEYPDMKGMPRDGDECCVPGCEELLKAGELAVAVIEVPRELRLREYGEAWVGYCHDLHVLDQYPVKDR